MFNDSSKSNLELKKSYEKDLCYIVEAYRSKPILDVTLKALGLTEDKQKVISLL